MLIRSLHLISAVALIGALFALRLLVLPSLTALAPEQGTLLMGKLMPRARRWMRLSLIVLLLTGIWLALSTPQGWDWAARGAVKLVSSLLLGVVVWLLTIPPQRRLAPPLLPRRRLLLDLGLGIGAIVLLVSIG